MMKSKTELNCEEISDIEHTKYFIEGFLEDFIGKNDVEIKEMLCGEEQDKHLFSIVIILFRLEDLLLEVQEYVLDRYYDGNEVEIKLKAQKKMCDEWNVPYFAPDDGKCICGEQIYKGITLKECLTEHITHCPYCSFAYND